MKLTLISRTYCHLCHDMEVALMPLTKEFGVAVEVLDVDADPELEARYNELVPVLLHEGKELCRYFLDAAKVRDYLRERAGLSHLDCIMQKGLKSHKE